MNLKKLRQLQKLRVSGYLYVPGSIQLNYTKEGVGAIDHYSGYEWDITSFCENKECDARSNCYCWFITGINNTIIRACSLHHNFELPNNFRPGPNNLKILVKREVIS